MIGKRITVSAPEEIGGAARPPAMRIEYDEELIDAVDFTIAWRKRK